MFLTEDLLRKDEAAERQLWLDPVRRITAVAGEVAERFVVAARLPPSRFRELVPAAFLEPRLVDGSLALWVSVLRLRHVAPAWWPLELGPAGLAAAIHLACIDRRDGRPAAWVGGRYSGSALASALSGLGFPAVDGGLTDQGQPGRLDVSAAEGLMQVHAAPGNGAASVLFPETGALTRLLAAPASYAPGRAAGRHAAVACERLADETLAPCSGWEGWLRTPWGDCTIDGIWRGEGGRWRWSGRGEVDGDGHAL